MTETTASTLEPQPERRALSFSRLDRFRSCPRAFKLHYVDRLPSEPGEPLAFGSAVHRALEVVYREHVLEERVAPLVRDEMLDAFQRACIEERCMGRELFNEGVAMLSSYVASQGVVDHHDVLAIEKPFELQIGEHTVIGSIDRIDRTGDESIEVIDYKSNRALFGRDEVEQSLQLAIYELAARALYPWAKTVRLTYLMLRHGSLRQSTVRVAADLEATRRYVATLGEAILSETEYPARLGPNCVYCDHRRNCSAYADALMTDRRPELTKDASDLVRLSREREHVATRAKLLYARREEIDRVLRAHLKDTDELVLGGTRYAMMRVTSVRHPFAETMQLLASATGAEPAAIAVEVAAIDKERLERFVDAQASAIGTSRACLLKAELNATAEQTVSARLWAKSLAKKGARAPASAEVSS